MRNEDPAAIIPIINVSSPEVHQRENVKNDLVKPNTKRNIPVNPVDI